MSTIDRVRKLLAVAECDGAGEHEADTARRLADQLMAAAGLTADDVAAASAKDPLDSIAPEMVDNGGKRPDKPVIITALAVARVVGCFCYLDDNVATDAHGKPLRSLMWIGTADQRERASAMHAWVCRQIERMASGVKRTVRGRRDARQYLHAYRISLADAIARKATALAAAREASPELQTSTALAVRNRIEEAIDRAKPPGLRNVSRRSRINAAGALAGAIDGEGVQFQHGVGGSNAKRLGSGS